VIVREEELRIPLFQVDAFSERLFGGNPAAVCPLGEWLPDATLQAIAAENNLAETAFIVRRGEDYELRWFTPAIEVDLCGHATLASALVVFTRLETNRHSVTFHTRSGPLPVQRAGTGLLTMHFPALPPEPCEPPRLLLDALGLVPQEVLRSLYYLAVVDDEATLRALDPNMDQLRQLDRLGVCVSAQGGEVDVVSRFFAPATGIPEDPVTGSAHCVLAPYWAARLGKTTLHARQVSARGGDVFCQLEGDQVALSGHAVLYLEGQIAL
jgi:PhzF family phenazine biosynthesis protein